MTDLLRRWLPARRYLLVGNIVVAVLSVHLGAAMPVEDVRFSLHNLSVRLNVPEMNLEVCSFCHTPHGGNTGVSGGVLWNKGAPLQTSFTMYGSTIAGTETSLSPESSSMMCLSCHDGVSGINSIVNLPGSGGYVPAGQYIKSEGPIPLTGYFAVGLGGDLSDDHPLSIVYRGEESNPPAGLKPSSTMLTDWSGANTIADLLREGRVECASCHNPHLSSDADAFLRTGDNQGSKLCLGCHDR